MYYAQNIVETLVEATKNVDQAIRVFKNELSDRIPAENFELEYNSDEKTQLVITNLETGTLIKPMDDEWADACLQSTKKLAAALYSKDMFRMNGIKITDEAFKENFESEPTSIEFTYYNSINSSGNEYHIEQGSFRKLLPKTVNVIPYYSFRIEKNFKHFRIVPYVDTYRITPIMAATIQAICIPDTFDMSQILVIFNEYLHGGSSKNFCLPISEDFMVKLWNHGIDPNNMNEEDYLFLNAMGIQ